MRKLATDWSFYADRMRDANAPAAPAPKQDTPPWQIDIERMKTIAEKHNKTLRDELEDNYSDYRDCVNNGYVENDQSVHDQYKDAIRAAKEAE